MARRTACILMLTLLMMSGCLGDDEPNDAPSGFTIQGPHDIQVANGDDLNYSVEIYVQNQSDLSRRVDVGSREFSKEFTLAGGNRTEFRNVTRDGHTYLVYVCIQDESGYSNRAIYNWDIGASDGELYVAIGEDGEIAITNLVA